MVNESWKSPLDWYITNFISTIKIVNFLLKKKYLKKFINFTTPEVYGNNKKKLSEEEKFNPSTPYALSRASADTHMKLMNKYKRFPIIFTRAANVYGPHQQLYRIVPKTIILLIRKKKVPIDGSGLTFRSFIHINDVNEALYKILQHGKTGETYHISTSNYISIIDLVKKIRSKFDNPLIAGNVVTGEMTEALILAGADIVKIGIGPGSVCTTRTVTGVGYPQLSAIIECADAAHGLRGHVISDGGCSKPGDVAKAFGAGADFVMLGGMFAGHEESGGELIEKDGKKYKQFYGMSSDTAMERYYGDIKNYRASEGETIALEYKGPIDKTIQQILGGLRSAATYVGAKDIKNLPKCTTFILKYK